MRPLILFVIAGVMATFIASPASAAVKPAVTIGVSATRAVDGTVVTVRGRISRIESGTKVVLQRSLGSGWTTAARPVVRHGRYTATYAPRLGSNLLRIRVPKTHSTRKAYSHAVAVKGTLRTTPAVLLSTEALHAAGRLRTSVARRVWLQAKHGTTWTTIDTGSTTHSGRFAVSGSLLESTSIRVVAPATKVHKKSYADLVSPSTGVTVTPVPQTNTHRPTISGETRNGATLTAHPGAWDPGVSFTYAWLRDGAPIPGASTSSYTLGVDDLATHIAVRVMGSRVGFVPATETSDPSEAIRRGLLTSTPVPTIDGPVATDGVVIAKPGAWDAADLSYAWQQDGVDIPGATTSSLQLPASDVGSEITVTVTGTRDGYEPASRTSEPSVVGVGALSRTPQPSISGDPAVGRTVSADPGEWDDGVDLTFAWLRDGEAIDGATSDTYTVDNADAGTHLAVRITGAKDAYADAAMTSQPTDIVTGGTLASTPEPAVAGTERVGEVLTATPGDWDPGTSLAYQWQRDGVDIPGATAESRVIDGVDLDAALTVTVTGSKPGFDSASRTSSPTGAIAPGVLAPAVPTVLGAVAVANVLSVDPGSWGPMPVDFSYQWQRNGVDIPGATDSSYVVPYGIVASRLSVRLTGAKLGFTSEVRTSEETGPISASTAPTAFGCGVPVLKSDGTAWRCTFDDEFSGTELDDRKWSGQQTTLSGVHGGEECLMDTPDNVAVRHGLLELTVRKEAKPFTCTSPAGDYRTEYTSGGVTTYGKFAQTYGRFEFRAKFPAPLVNGLQSSLWLYPLYPSGRWPASGEIDVAEVYSNYPDRAFPYMHYNTSKDVAPAGPNGVTNWHCMLSDPTAFHTYVAEWTSAGIKIRYDGELCLDHTWSPADPLVAPAPFNRPFTMLMTQVLGTASNNFDPENTPLPAATEIDYVRAWS